MTEQRHPSGLARTPAPPYYAVVFTSRRRETPDDGYDDTARRMAELAAQQPGFLGVESARDAEGIGITVSYWESLHSIRNWKANMDHLEAQSRGKGGFYSAYRTRICKVEREYGLELEGGSGAETP